MDARLFSGVFANTLVLPTQYNIPTNPYCSILASFSVFVTALPCSLCLRFYLPLSFPPLPVFIHSSSFHSTQASHYTMSLSQAKVTLCLPTVCLSRWRPHALSPSPAAGQPVSQHHMHHYHRHHLCLCHPVHHLSTRLLSGWLADSLVATQLLCSNS